MAAVPTAVTQRRQRDEAELRAQGIDPNSTAPVDVQLASGATPAQTPTPAPSAPAFAPTPTPTPDASEALRAENARLQEALRTSEGRTSASSKELDELKRQNQVLSDNRTFLESRLSEQGTQITTLQEQLSKLENDRSSADVQAVAKALDETPLTEVEQKEYAEHLPVFEKVARRVLAAAVKPVIERLAVLERVVGDVKEIKSTLPGLKESVDAGAADRMRAEEEAFVQREITAYYPDFPIVRGTEAWKKYLASDVGQNKGPVGAWLRAYRQQGNAAGIRALIEPFFKARDSQPTLDTLAVPGKTGADVPEKPAAAKMKASEYQRNLKLFTFKKMPKADWESYRARWEAAQAAGNVDMDVELR